MPEIVIVVVAVVTAIIGVVVYGQLSWRVGTRDLRSRAEHARETVTPSVVELHKLDGLPEPVQRFFGKVLTDGQPTIADVRVLHRGTFNVGRGIAQWKPFNSEQYVITRRPGFVWDARIRMMPGIIANVHDAYVSGQGVLRSKAFGLIPVMQQDPTPELARGELMRYLAEAAWYPTALLPGQGARWEPRNENQATATLVDGNVEAQLVFTFDEQGLISSVYSDARPRDMGGTQTATAWQGRFWNYEERSGMLVPIDGEVAWLFPEGAVPYWRGHIESISYGFVQ